MGDGGVACLASHHIIDHFSICGGNTNGSTRTSSSTLSSTRKIGKMNGRNMKKLKRVREKTEELGLKSSVDTVKEALANSSSNNTNVGVNKDEVEEGELGTFPIENGEFIVERPNTTARKYGLKSEIEKGEVIGEKWRRSSGKVEKGEPFSYGKWRKPDEVEKNGFSSRSWRVSSKEEPEKGEYVQEWRRKSGVVKDDYGYSRARGHDSSKDNRWKGDGEWTQPLSRPSLSSSGKCSSIKGLSRCGNRLKKKFSRYEPDTLEKTHRINSKIVDEVQCELGNGKNHSREYTSVNRLKRQGADADASEWRLRGVSDGYMSSKSRKVSDNAFHTPHSSERYVSRSTERSYRNPSFLSKYVSSDRYSSKHFKPSYDKYNGSPLHSERSPHNRAGHLDHWDQSPERYEPSLYDQNSRYDHCKSPNERNQGYGYSRSPHDCSPSPSDRSPIFDYRKRSPSCSGLPPHDQSQYLDRMVQTPISLEQSPAHLKLQETNRKIGFSETKQISGGNRGPEEKSKQKKDPGEGTLRVSAKESEYQSKLHEDISSRIESVVVILKEKEILPVPDANANDQTHDQSWYLDCMVQTPISLEQSPAYLKLQETNRKIGFSENKQISGDNRGPEEKYKQKKDPGEGKLRVSAKESEYQGKLHEDISARIESVVVILKEEEILPDPDANANDQTQEAPCDSGSTEEMASMEEDMDICNTPPHEPVLSDAIPAKWFYIDHIGEEQGPFRLSDLKKLVEQGFLTSDHLIKQSDCERWVTVENAVSPLVTTSFQPIVSDAVTQIVSPPDAPGNLLADGGEVTDCPTPFSSDCTSYIEGCLVASETLKDLQIDERVGALLEGFNFVPGRELEVVGEALQITFVDMEWERLELTEGIPGQQPLVADIHDQISFEAATDSMSKGTMEVKSTILTPSEKDIPLNTDNDEWFSGLWWSKGGDWKRNDEAVLDRHWKQKAVLNDGYPLCQMQKCGIEDPRWRQEDELYYPSLGQKFDLPSWAFKSPDEWNDSSCAYRSALSKFNNVRGALGMMLPVVSINACVVKDHESFVSEPRVKARGKDIYSTRSSRRYSVSSDTKRSPEEVCSHPQSISEQDSHGSSKSLICKSVSVSKDCVCTVDELKLYLGDWYYFDGAGNERGPSSFSEFQVLAQQGVIPMNSSIFRKVDKIWVPIFSDVEESISGRIMQQVKNDSSDSGRSPVGVHKDTLDGKSRVSGAFHSLHPQFISYTIGKLHELVMKSYKSREFAAAINEVLDPWINARLSKKEMEKNMYSSAIIQKSDQFRASKRFRVDENEEYEIDELSGSAKGDYSFDELCSDAIFSKEQVVASKIEGGTWGQLDGCVLARVFHFLRADIRSLVNATLTCKFWRYMITCYKDVSRKIDLSSLAPNCNDTMVWNVMSGYDTEKIFCLVLRGCTSITSSMLEKILKSFLNLSFVDIRGCNQFEELTCSFPNINWIRDRGTESKFRSAKHLSDKQLDDSSGLRDYLENSDRRDSATRFFRQSLYKRTKLFDARKSSSILSREANLSRFNVRKSNIAYKHMKDFLDLSLKDIMKENTYEFLVPKVAQIDGRMRSGYYAGRGLRAVKEDIIRICRDAIKAKNRSDVTGINRIVTLFIRLATRVEDRLNSSCDRDEFLKTWKDDTPPGFSSSSSKHKKNCKGTAKKSLIRSKRSFSINIFSDLDDYVSDHEIKRCLAKLNKKLDSGSEMSDNLDRSSDEGLTDGESTDSNAASDSDLHSEVGIRESRVEGYSPPNDAFDSLTEREWGARMTKASLVPPVTRKYEVIDHYVVVADEEEVRRKMQASLPEDYAEKLHAQRSGIDGSDMQIPEVKDYKPRKQLGVEVIEQEVYGIDPYTHNLLLDSMPDESDWSPLDKHLFIEDMLLRTINKQVRHLTGSGNMSLTYPLRPAFKEILEIAEENNDLRTAKLSDYVLKAIDSRPEDNYVSYRKGLGVVCNKEGGFNEDDFVVDFLGEVYPAWRWFEKQDGIRSLQKNSEDPAPEFYNIYLERPKGDADGYDLVVVDAMHKANYASRICHSCRPNCEAKVIAVDGQYQIGIYSVSPIQYGEEITFDYNSVTESKEEYEASVCLCGSHVCRGSFLNLTGEGAFLKVLNEYHGILDRHQLLLGACELNSVSEEDSIDLLKAGLGSCLLDGLPDWLIAYSARLVRFINFERTKLPKEILRHNLEEKKKYFADISLEAEKNDAEVQAEGVYNQRLQNLALTLDKVRYVMRCIFGEAKNAPPPLDRLCPQEAASHIWNGEGSLVDELIQCVAPYIEDTMLSELQAKIHAHNPSSADNVEMELQKSLIWLRDELRNLPCTYKCRHDAAADVIHTYAHTQSFFRIKEYKPVTSPPVYISSLDLGPKYADKLGSDGHEYCKTYGENYCLGQLIYWYTQANAEPDGILARASRGCLSLPDIGSFYAQVQKPSRQRVYGPRTVKFMLSRMEKQPQRPWPKDRIWAFKTRPKIVGSPMLDAVLNKAPLGKDMLHWLKHRLPIFQAKLDW